MSFLEKGGISFLDQNIDPYKDCDLELIFWYESQKKKWFIPPVPSLRIFLSHASFLPHFAPFFIFDLHQHRSILKIINLLYPRTTQQVRASHIRNLLKKQKSNFSQNNQCLILTQNGLVSQGGRAFVTFPKEKRKLVIQRLGYDSCRILWRHTCRGGGGGNKMTWKRLVQRNFLT